VASGVVHLLDVGAAPYGDATVVRAGRRWILIDGAHPGDEQAGAGRADLPAQLEQIIGNPPPYQFDLLIVSHAHLDHIGALPAMVNSGLVEFEWALVPDPSLAWGRPVGTDGRTGADTAAGLVAALREEPMSPASSDTALGPWIADAMALQDRYRMMLAKLARAGTRVVRHVLDDTSVLQRSFRAQGLKVLGPTEAQVLICAEQIGQSTDALEAQVRGLAAADRGGRSVDLYRRLMSSGTDSSVLADASRLGEAVNLQSLVVSVTLDGRRTLLGGDMPFAAKHLPDPRLRTEMSALESKIAESGPFAFAKATHHGSANGLHSQLIHRFGTPIAIGITTGRDSRGHPHPDLIAQLAARRGLSWVRTDRNGLASIEFSNRRKARVAVTRGETNDASPPGGDGPDRFLPAATRVATGPAVAPGLLTSRALESQGGIEVTVRLPSGHHRVVVEVTPQEPQRVVQDRAGQGGGQRLAGILAVTSSAGLTENLGQLEAERVLHAMASLGAKVLDMPMGISIAEAAARAREELNRGAIRGVLLAGGYDVVPSQVVDALPPEVRAAMTVNDDEDDFIVWADDAYGDRDGDGLAEVPVSRIPDARSAALVDAALSAPAVNYARATAIRNLARPWAERIFNGIGGVPPMLVSEPTAPGPPAHPLAGELVYLMLHGHFQYAHAFEGERADGTLVEAIGVSDVGPAPGAVVLAGCCWGALPIDTLAREAAAGRTFASWPPERSMALTYLKQGARAFVGCTGTHYSPPEEPYFYYGEPMHEYFFAELMAGQPPAAALFEAKRRYVVGIPFGPDDLRSQAIEYKIWRQFICLGIGW
jgi:beta-lactamase superfamily II metal-dependent hydrolase